ncbi:MAG: Asp-tRNA(Asn)/Glu-tRNA(Gln) amidotransferase subunit GatB [Candidatus Parvarchaeota archaeon]|nr:Asp-tRNA(Asn)/Glu-tRNA(Gln) amidotransferase subunit GatB [Candidatus Rehaiarchaeum fermentans]
MTKIGLEIHVALNTKTKLFCKDSTESNSPNTSVCPICLGYPGSKPQLNKKAIDLAIKAALMLNCKVRTKFWFDRKIYFYPDLAKNFQITQHEATIGYDGHFSIRNKEIRIREIHLEEDPAKIVYTGSIENSKYVLLDYNRSGVPLIEIVTEPDFSNSNEVALFLRKLIRYLEYLDLFNSSREGAIRCDVNVSIEGGERVEVKNVSGIENIKRAIDYEILRQTTLLNKGEKIKRETRHFDETLGITIGLRSKETEEDYGYIYEPDIPIIKINEEKIEKLKNEVGELPDQRKERIVLQYKINNELATAIVSERDLADLFEYCCKEINDYQFVAKWIGNYLKKSLNWNNIKFSQSKVTKEKFLEFLKDIKNKKINEREAKELIKTFVDRGEIAQAESSKEDIQKVISEFYDEISPSINEKGINHIIGKILKKINYKADPKELKKLIEKIKEEKSK